MKLKVYNRQMIVKIDKNKVSGKVDKGVNTNFVTGTPKSYVDARDAETLAQANAFCLANEPVEISTEDINKMF